MAVEAIISDEYFEFGDKLDYASFTAFKLSTKANQLVLRHEYSFCPRVCGIKIPPSWQTVVRIRNHRSGLMKTETQCKASYTDVA